MAAILGIDEVGRGPLAGPLVVGAVILPEERPKWVAELRDSKKLSAKRRESLEKIIREFSAFGLGWVSPGEIDEYGISEALRMATRRAVEEVRKAHVSFSQIIIDGKVNFLRGTSLERYVSTKVRADDLIKEVSAASIIAKQARDAYMKEVAKKYPEYGFDKHVGYGTARHIEAIKQFGIIDEHRLSFEPIKSMVGFKREIDKSIKIESGEVSVINNVVKNTTAGGENDEKSANNTTTTGKRGESAVCEYLIKRGHEIIKRNFRTRLYEIDIISVLEEKIYFTEVKYRKNDYAGGGLAAISKDKLDRMKFAAEDFLRRFRTDKEPVLAVAEVSGSEFVVKEWFKIG